MTDNGEAPTPEAIGWAGWTVLHTTAAAFPNEPTDQHKRDMRDFIRSWSRVYPCSICAYHMRQQLQVMPPDVSSKRGVSRWMCELHNSVNVLLGKAAAPCDPELVLRRWHPTYPHMDDEPAPEELIAQARAQRAADVNGSAGQSSYGVNSSHMKAGQMSFGWGAKSDGGGTGVPDSATDTDAVLRRLASCKAFCPEDKHKKQPAS